AGGSAPSEGCATICNRVGHSDTDEKECAEKCTCSNASGTAERCWMLCVPTLPTNQCAKSDQTCTGQKITSATQVLETQALATPLSNSPPAGSPSSPSPTAGSPPTTSGGARASALMC
ncbi:hypothetical protein PybrP1_005754, partial [[Pythium] brassicae (nom. inval.)]